MNNLATPRRIRRHRRFGAMAAIATLATVGIADATSSFAVTQEGSASHTPTEHHSEDHPNPFADLLPASPLPADLLDRLHDVLDRAAEPEPFDFPVERPPALVDILPLGDPDEETDEDPAEDEPAAEDAETPPLPTTDDPPSVTETVDEIVDQLPPPSDVVEDVGGALSDAAEAPDTLCASPVEDEPTDEEAGGPDPVGHTLDTAAAVLDEVCPTDEDQTGDEPAEETADDAKIDEAEETDEADSGEPPEPRAERTASSTTVDTLTSTVDRPLSGASAAEAGGLL